MGFLRPLSTPSATLWSLSTEASGSWVRNAVQKRPWKCLIWHYICPRFDLIFCQNQIDVSYSFLKIGHSRPLFLYFRFFNALYSKYVYLKFCRWLDSNRGLMVLEVTTLPTEPMPKQIVVWLTRNTDKEIRGSRPIRDVRHILPFTFYLL